MILCQSGMDSTLKKLYISIEVSEKKFFIVHNFSTCAGGNFGMGGQTALFQTRMFLSNLINVGGETVEIEIGIETPVVDFDFDSGTDEITPSAGKSV